MDHIYGVVERVTASTLIYTGAGFLMSVLIGTDGVNDPVVAVYDYTDATDPTKRIIPSTTYDASALGLNGVVLQFVKRFSTGLYVNIANIGNGEVILDYRRLTQVSIGNMR